MILKSGDTVFFYDQTKSIVIQGSLMSIHPISESYKVQAEYAVFENGEKAYEWNGKDPVFSVKELWLTIEEAYEDIGKSHPEQISKIFNN